jgi:hypothetical protein
MIDIIVDMISKAEETHDIDLITYIKRLINQFIITINCPSNWRTIALSLSAKYDSNSWVYEQLELWEYE